MRVIGIDPGLNVTGFGILEKTARKILLTCYGVIRPPKNKSLPERLQYLYVESVKLLQQYHPDVLAVEDSFFSQNVKTALLLGQARGTLLLAAANNDIPCKEYAPRKVKQSVVGNGAASKEQVQYMVKQILRMETLPKPIDASDAIAVALCYLNQLNLEKYD